MTKGVWSLWSILMPHGGRRVKNATIDDSLLGVGLYTVAETSRILSYSLEHRVTATNLRRWAYGRTRLLKRQPAIITPSVGMIAESYLFTFTDLIELLTIAALRHDGMRMELVYAAYQKAREEFGEHPFAKQKYSIYGSSIFVKNAEYHGDMVDLATGRRAFEEILKPLLHDIVVYVGDVPTQLTPLGKDRTVLLDPDRSFGAPINRDTGIPTQILFGMNKSGESEETVAKWYGVSVEGVRDAIEYETALQMAA
jgi:uncharacterized protein (DUF433 family)